MTQAEYSDRELAKKAYQAVLRTVDLQTTTVQPPGVRTSTIVRLLSSRFDREVVERALEAARSNDDLESWPDQQGRKRYTFSTPNDVGRIAVWEAESRSPRKQIVGWANRRSNELTGGDSDV